MSSQKSQYNFYFFSLFLHLRYLVLFIYVLIFIVCYGNIPPQGTTSYTRFLLQHSKPQSFVI